MKYQISENADNTLNFLEEINHPEEGRHPVMPNVDNLENLMHHMSVTLAEVQQH